MSKEFEAFVRIAKQLKVCDENCRYLDIIETALKNYEELTNKPVMLYGSTHGHTKKLIDIICKNYKEVKITNLEDEKKLKVLEIIKEKKVDCLLITISQTVMDYNDMCEEDNVNLTQEEYDLLKEVML